MKNLYKPEKIRNIAIIAHIDHGKTTMLDGLLRQSNIFRDNEKVPERVMDSYDQEKERGITIFAKHTSLFFEDFKINIFTFLFAQKNVLTAIFLSSPTSRS